MIAPVNDEILRQILASDSRKMSGGYTLTGFSHQSNVEKEIKPILITPFGRDHYKTNFKTPTNY
jgi:hypothetical protein